MSQITATCNDNDLCPHKCLAGDDGGWLLTDDDLGWLKTSALSFTDTEIVYKCEIGHITLLLHEQQTPGVCDSIW